MKKYVTATCPACGVQREVQGSTDLVRTCRSCKTPRPKTIGARKLMKNGYIRIQTEHGYQYEHRYVWEQVNGPIPSGCIIHHIDGNKTNNNIANLQLMTKKEHDSSESNSRWLDVKQGNRPPVFIPHKINLPVDEVVNTIHRTGSLRKTAAHFRCTKGAIIRVLNENNICYTYTNGRTTIS